MTRVVMGLLFDLSGRILIAKRNPQKRYGGLWEFPGGKVEAGESYEEALVREIREELDAEISIGKVYPGYLFSYRSLSAEFIPVSAAIKPGDITLMEHDACRFVRFEEIGGYDLSPYDQGAVELINSDRFAPPIKPDCV
ncbi:MAG: (deoxy)nucleoside triphosphate pyrophosphohydrolase [Desulfofustis sp.]